MKRISTLWALFLVATIAAGGLGVSSGRAAGTAGVSSGGAPLRKIAEFELAAASFAPDKVLPSRFIGMQNGQVPADDHASTAEFAQDFGH